MPESKFRVTDSYENPARRPMLRLTRLRHARGPIVRSRGGGRRNRRPGRQCRREPRAAVAVSVRRVPPSGLPAPRARLTPAGAACHRATARRKTWKRRVSGVVREARPASPDVAAHAPIPARGPIARFARREATESIATPAAQARAAAFGRGFGSFRPSSRGRFQAPRAPLTSAGAASQRAITRRKTREARLGVGGLV